MLHYLAAASSRLFAKYLTNENEDFKSFFFSRYFNLFSEERREEAVSDLTSYLSSNGKEKVNSLEKGIACWCKYIFPFLYEGG